MIRPLKPLLVALIITALALPASLLVRGQSSDLAQPATQNQISDNSYLIQVTSRAQSSFASVTPSLSFSCDLSAASAGNLVQDTGLLNLNQPANCFALRNATLSVQERLAVTQVQSSATVHVVQTPAATWNNVIASSPQAQTTPALPASSIMLFSVLIVLALDPLQRIIRHSSNRLAQSLTLSQLQVRRC